MQFSSVFFLAASVLASFAAATNNTVTFFNQDSKSRTVYFTANAGLQAVQPITINGVNNTVTASFPEAWAGNFYSVTEGDANTPGMLGEISFQAYGMTFYDVSAIVNPDDDDGIKILRPLEGDGTESFSGCQSYQEVCKTAYNVWDDVQTVSTESTHMLCLLGTESTAKRTLRFAKRVVDGLVTRAH